MGRTRSEGTGGVTVQADPARDMVEAAGRRAVARLEPDELPFYDQVAAQWRERGTWSAPGSSIGIGIDAALISEVVLQAVSSAFGEIMVLGGTPAGAGLLHRLRKRRTTPAEPPPAFTPEQLTRLRDACVRHALALEMTPDQADVLADAAVAGVTDPDGD